MASTKLRNEQMNFSDGWVSASETWVYASADDPTFTFTIAGVDLTGKYSAGMRIKLTQTTVKYFIITKVEFSTNTTITVYGGTDYDLADAAISLNYYSTQKAPQGFPLDPTKWTISLVDTGDRSQATPTLTTWYNLGGLTLSMPIGIWRAYYEVFMFEDNGAITIRMISSTLSKANNTQDDAELTGSIRLTATSGVVTEHGITIHKEKTLVATAKTSYYLNAMNTYGTISNMYFLGNVHPTVVRFICAYL